MRNKMYLNHYLKKIGKNIENAEKNFNVVSEKDFYEKLKNKKALMSRDQFLSIICSEITEFERGCTREGLSGTRSPYKFNEYEENLIIYATFSNILIKKERLVAPIIPYKKDEIIEFKYSDKDFEEPSEETIKMVAACARIAIYEVAAGIELYGYKNQEDNFCQSQIMKFPEIAEKKNFEAIGLYDIYKNHAKGINAFAAVMQYS